MERTNYDFSVEINGIDITCSRMINDKEEGVVFVLSNDSIIFNFDPKKYELKFDFKGKMIKTIFFKLNRI